jgi:hypothetical protein
MFAMEVSNVVEEAMIIRHVNHNPAMRSIQSNKWNLFLLLTAVVTSVGDYRRDFGLDIGFIDHFNI